MTKPKTLDQLRAEKERDEKQLAQVDDIFEAVLLQSGSVFLFPDIKQRLSDNQLGIITHIISGSKFPI